MSSTKWSIKNNFYVAVVGVPGVGKTTICKKVSKKINLPYINYGDLMLEIAKRKKLARDDKELFSLDIDTQRKIWEEAAIRIRKIDAAMIDLHGVDQSPIGYIISLPINYIVPKLIILVESEPGQILLQRKTDTKMRIKDTLKTLKEHINILRISMIICSSMLGSKLYILKNIKLEESVKEMAWVIEKEKDIYEKCEM